MTSPSIDPERFKAFEHAAWNDSRVAAAYSSGFLTLTSQTGAALLDAVQAGPGRWLLDVACGPGIIAGVAAERGARTLGVDFAAEMIAIAQRLHPGLRYEVGDAEALDFPDSSFDAVVMNFGLLHLARPDQAIGEAWRVLKPGGNFAFTVWAPPQEAVAFQIVLEAVGRKGNPDVPLPPGPPFFRFSEPEESERALTAAGFIDAQVVKLPLVWRLRDAEALYASYLEGTARSRGLLLGQTRSALAAIHQAVLEAASAYRTETGALALPMAALLVRATKPAEPPSSL